MNVYNPPFAYGVWGSLADLVSHSLSALPKDTTSELAGLFSHYPLNAERQAGKLWMLTRFSWNIWRPVIAQGNINIFQEQTIGIIDLAM